MGLAVGTDKTMESDMGMSMGNGVGTSMGSGVGTWMGIGMIVGTGMEPENDVETRAGTGMETGARMS